jgi:hypothetical protein
LSQLRYLHFVSANTTTFCDQVSEPTFHDVP